MMYLKLKKKKLHSRIVCSNNVFSVFWLLKKIKMDLIKLLTEDCYISYRYHKTKKSHEK